MGASIPSSCVLADQRFVQHNGGSCGAQRERHARSAAAEALQSSVAVLARLAGHRRHLYIIIIIIISEIYFVVGDSWSSECYCGTGRSVETNYTFFVDRKCTNVLYNVTTADCSFKNSHEYCFQSYDLVVLISEASAYYYDSTFASSTSPFSIHTRRLP